MMKNALPEARYYSHKEFGLYSEHFRHLLGIDSEMALRLLHKTQSAKNLGDINTFLREFMLEKPKTFEVADNLVMNSTNLNSAHQAVVTASQQIETLKPAYSVYQQLTDSRSECEYVRQLIDGVDTFTNQCHIALLHELIRQSQINEQTLNDEIIARQDKLDNVTQQLNELRDQHCEAGGGRLE